MTIQYGASRQDFSIIRWFETEEERDTFLLGFPDCIGITADFTYVTDEDDNIVEVIEDSNYK